MKKNIAAFMIAIIAALAVSFFANDNALVNLRFHLGLYERADDEKAVEETLKYFNRHFATLFNTGGRQSSALNQIPAANLIKRRIIQEIGNWAKDNRLIVYDKDVFEIESIDFLSPGRAVAVAHEVWFLNVQNREKRQEKSGVKANPIRVRYQLARDKDRWRVIEYEVFGKDDSLPPFKIERSGL